MARLAALIFTIAATALAGSAIVVSLTLGYDTLRPILVAAACGAAAAVPVSWAVARKLSRL